MTYQLENATVLVIDDMAPMLGLVSSILKAFGFKNIHTALDAEEGFEKVCRVQPDIVITDWLMGPYDGVELVKKIRTDARSPNKFVPVILMTGYSHRIRVEKARDSGVTEFLVKPFNAQDLCSRIEHLVEKPRRFVELPQFFGPDRRRRKPKGYGGPSRRQSDEYRKISGMEKGAASTLLRDLRTQASSIVDDKGKNEKDINPGNTDTDNNGRV